MHSVLPRRVQPLLASCGADALPAPELGTLSSSKPDAHCDFGPFMTMEKLKFRVS